MAKLVETLKQDEQDHEFYPTTNEIITALARDIGVLDKEGRCYRSWEREKRDRFSLLDIGAGNGKVLTRLRELCGFDELLAIEKSSRLCRQMDESILVVGTEFHEQSLMSKMVDVIYCNPPYSQFEQWSTRIIRESASARLYLTIPQRWIGSIPIADAIKFREANWRKIGDFDFEDAEDRTARAKVHLVRVDLPKKDDDAFERWFGEQFADVIEKFKHDKPKCSKCGKEFAEEEKRDENRYYCNDCGDYSDGKGGRRRPFASLVVGPNYPEALVGIYNDEMAKIQRNYQALSELDPDVMREFEILPGRIMACLKERMKGMKNDYWMELFSHLDAITNRLTSTSRKELLNVLHKHVQVDFTASNILEVVIWVIKNANSYIDRQLVKLYQRMCEKANVRNYKSNQRVFTDDDWRYLQGYDRDRNGQSPSRYALDYRIVLERIGGCGPRYGSIELAEGAAEFIGDLMTVAGNLGFRTKTEERYAATSYQARRAWRPGEKYEFFYEDKKLGRRLLFDIRAYQNGNSHIRINQDLMLALNVEYGRLNGWLRNPQQAAEELNEPKAAQFFGTNLQLGTSNPAMMLAEKND